MTISLLTTCRRHEIIISGNQLTVDTFIPDANGHPGVSKRPWTRTAIPLPKLVHDQEVVELSEDNVTLKLAHARRDGIDVIVDVAVPSAPRAWLWRLSPLRVRANTPITHRTEDGLVLKVFSSFQAIVVTDARDAPTSVVRFVADDADGTTTTELDLSEPRNAPAKFKKWDNTFDLFVSYKARDVDATEARRIVEATKAAGLRVWFAPERLLTQTAFRKPIRKAIEKSRGFVIIWSDHSDEHLDGEKDAEPGESLSCAENQVISSHDGGVMKMNQLWEAKYILGEAEGDSDKLNRLWILDARSSSKRESPINTAFKAAFKQMSNVSDVLDGLHVPSDFGVDHLIQTMVKDLRKS